MSPRLRTLGSVLRFIGTICTSSTLSWDSFLHSQLGDQGPPTLCATPSLTSVDSTSRTKISGVWSRLGAAARLRANPEQITRPLLSAGTLRERSAPGRGTETEAGVGGACLVENASSAVVPSVVRFSEMFPRVSAVLPFRPLSRLPLCSAGPEASAATVVPLASPHGTVRYRVSALVGPQVSRHPLSRLRHIQV